MTSTEDSDYESRYDDTYGYSESAVKVSSKTSHTEESSENGNYYDQQTSDGKIVRVASGEFKEKTTSKHDNKGESSYQSETEGDYYGDSYTIVSSSEAVLGLPHK